MTKLPSSPALLGAPLLALMLALLTSATALAAGAKKECKYNASAESTVTIANQFGTIDVKPSSTPQVSISATPASDKVQVDCNQVGSRITAVTRFAQNADSSDGRVDYELSVPQQTNLSIRNAQGAIHLDGVRGDLTLRGDAARVDVSNVTNSHVHIQTVNGPVTLSHVDGGHIEVLSTSGKVAMTAVSAPKLTVSTTDGDISYDGDFGHGGEYWLSNHSGAIDVSLPASASVDVDARAPRGSVQNDFPLQAAKPQPGNALLSGHSFAGTSNSGSSSVQLRSFSGTIRVKKR